jgi:glycosyltransferase involved in cell wall biosynthesis|tara:strand:+ start:8580 stop:9452 length:873 start_codon:yes stop_codon:yes gene_type:complete
MIKLSVLIPTYNRADSLDRTLESLSAQTYDDKFLCLISDNKSTDNTKEVIEKWKGRETNFNIEYYEQENELLPIDNWEFLINKSNTQYSKILFDDDWIKPSFLTEMINLIEIKKVDCVVSNIDIHVEKQNKNEILKSYFKLKEGVMTSDWIIDSFIETGPRINVSPSASIIKTQKLKDGFYYSLKNTECSKRVIGNDLVINYFQLFNGGSVYYTPDSLAICGAGDDSITVSTDDRILYYCYLNTLIDLINNSSTKISNLQKRQLNKKILFFTIRRILNPKYKTFLTNRLN